MRKTLCTATAFAATLAAPALGVAATPAVTKAQDSVIAIRAGETGQGSAVRLGAAGYVTSSALVARTTEITVTSGKGQASPANVKLSDLPSGLALLQPRSDALADAPLGVTAAKLGNGTPLWLLSRARDKNKVAPARRATVVSATRGVIVLSLTAADGIGRIGGALVDSSGRVRGVLVPPDPGTVCPVPTKAQPKVKKPAGCKPARQVKLRAIALTAAPAAVAAAAPATGGGFPAIPVTVGLGVFLLLSQLVLRWRAGRELAPTVGAGTAPVSAPVPAYVDAGGDDLEISLRPKNR